MKDSILFYSLEEIWTFVAMLASKDRFLLNAKKQF